MSEEKDNNTEIQEESVEAPEVLEIRVDEEIPMDDKIN